MANTDEGKRMAEDLAALKQAVSASRAGDIQRISVALIEVLNRYYNTILSQATKSQRWAMATLFLSLASLFGAAFFRWVDQADVATYIKGAGQLAGLASGVLFLAYVRTTLLLANYHRSLDQVNRFLLANNICEALEGPARDKARAELVSALASLQQPAAGLLSLLDRGAPQPPPQVG